MTPRDLLTVAIAPALSLLPEHMDSPAARAMLIAIALQESGARHRRQINGPAVSFWQFEPIGVRGVQTHHATAEFAAGVEQVLEYRQGDTSQIIEHNDTLAAAYARLLLWQCPGPLPSREDADEGWNQYMSLWRPGKPHPETWEGHYRAAWAGIT